MIENAVHSFSKADIVFLGLNYYGTCGEKGKGPSLIRQALNSFSSFDFKTGKDCFDELRICDAGNIKASRFKTLREKLLKKLRKTFNGTLISLGGEHLVSLPVIEALRKKQDFNVLVLDAHADFYNKYKGRKNSYATVTRRISELVDKVVISGVRDLTINELEGLSKASNVQVMDLNKLNKISRKKPWYISIDLDVLDPIFCPEVSTPVPFGPSLSDLVKVLNTVCLGHRVIGIDFVELTAKKKALSSVNAGGMVMNYLKRRCE